MATATTNTKPPIHIQISTARTAIPPATKTLISAFEADPVTAHMLHHLPQSARRDALSAMFHLTGNAALLAGGELWSASTEPSTHSTADLVSPALKAGDANTIPDFQAAALIFPPHTSLDNLGASSLPSLLLKGGLLPTLWHFGPATFLNRLNAYTAATEPAKKATFPPSSSSSSNSKSDSNGVEGFYYVNLIGADAAHRGKGLAPALIKALQRRAAGERRRIYLEASNHGARKVYLKLGFRDVYGVVRMGVGEVDESGEVVEGGKGEGVPLWPMLWKAEGGEQGS